jgi:ferredoxin-NADP reductase
MKQWLDRVTGAVTMYKLVIIVLSAIAVVALVLSLLGQLGSTPLALLASAAAAIVAAMVTTIAVSKIARSTAHLDSGFITGLLVFLIMRPTLDVLGLAYIALASAIAAASKYVLAIRRRHVFNPAALGTFAVGIIAFSTGVAPSYPAWWVGTAFLLPVVTIGAFLVLYRTQRLTLGATFIALALVISIGLALSRGASFTDALSFSLLSSPIVFFAGFMFSEPLTLPPRRWQQFVEAVVVAALIPIPFAIGPVTNTPQFALLVGNVIGFAFGQRRGIHLTYLGKKQIGPTTWELSFQPASPVRFLPGQYMELTIPHRAADFRGSRRYFSISSAPGADEPITFALTLPTKSSSFKKALLDLEPGTAVHGTSVGGDFALPADVSEPLLLVAGGIGITPFASQLAHAVKRGEKRDVVVVYANSASGDLPYRDLLENSGARVVLYGPSPTGPLPKGWEFGGEGRVTGERLAAAVPDAASRRAFVSGPPSLVNDLRRALKSQGAKRVHTDYFSGY